MGDVAQGPLAILFYFRCVKKMICNIGLCL